MARAHVVALLQQLKADPQVRGSQSVRPFFCVSLRFNLTRNALCVTLDALFTLPVGTEF